MIAMSSSKSDNTIESAIGDIVGYIFIFRMDTLFLKKSDISIWTAAVDLVRAYLKIIQNT
jgi:hypothetical protein